LPWVVESTKRSLDFGLSSKEITVQLVGKPNLAHNILSSFMFGRLMVYIYIYIYIFFFFPFPFLSHVNCGLTDKKVSDDECWSAVNPE